MDQIRELFIGIRSMQLQTKRLMERATKDETLSIGLIFLMFRLAQVGSLKITEISEHFGCTAGAATGMTDKLEERGLVQRVRSSEDRRIVQVMLTDEGKARLEKIGREFHMQAAQAFANVPEERLRTMIETVREIKETLETHLGGEENK